MSDSPDFFLEPDPWGYRTNPDDILRKEIIISAASIFTKLIYDRALDLGALEGWISEDLPANIVHGYEISDVAAARFPPDVIHVKQPEGKYDLVVATGVLYGHYDWQHFVDLIKEHANGIILTCNIVAWESQSAISQIPGRQIYTAEFPYREFTQKLRVFHI